MVNPVPLPSSRTNDLRHGLDALLARALQFDATPTESLALTAGQLRSYAEEEASFGRISVDADGVTAGMRLHLLQNAKDIMAEWGQAKGAFLTALQPFRAAIDAVESLDREVIELKRHRATIREQIEKQAEADRGYVAIKSDYEEKEATRRALRDREGRRKVTMAAYSPFYWIALFCIGIAEWLINYDTFFIFMGVPAIAAGTTIILGVLLALSAHGHGTLLRQWAANFGRDVPANKRRRGYMFLTLSTFSLGLVLWAAGGFRYAIAIHLVSGQPQINILGAQATIVINPLRDVLLSLLANLAAWAVGVFLAYLSHDENPDLMSAEHEFKKATRRIVRSRRPTDALVITQEAQVEKEITERERAATVSARDVTVQRDMFHQVLSHEDTLVNGILSVVRRNAETYRDFLTQIVLSRKGEVQIVRGETALTPYDYKALDIDITAERILGGVSNR
jgi:hypothetical protein